VIARRGGVVWIGLAIAALALGYVAISAFCQAPRKTETGLVTAVDSTGLTNVQGFTIRTDDGRTVAFKIGVLENGIQFPPGHLLEHRATGVKVVVTYRQENGEMVAVRIEDAPGASPSGTSHSGRLIYLRSASALSSSSGVKISSNDALTIPSLPTTKT
jgi:hypothetical protein